MSGPGGQLRILDDITLSAQRGETVAIVGASGSGKSTLLGLLAGLDEPSSGQIELAGRALKQMNEDQRAQLRAQHVGFVFQSFHLLPSLTAVENVALTLELGGSRDAEQRAREVLNRVGLEHRLDHYPNQLSGGEQQRVALARAFVHQPDILFADEPTGNLDRKTGEQVTELMFAMNAEHGTTLVLVTHDATLAARCQRRITLDDGRIA